MKKSEYYNILIKRTCYVYNNILRVQKIKLELEEGNYRYNDEWEAEIKRDEILKQLKEVDIFSNVLDEQLEKIIIMYEEFEKIKGGK